MLIGRDVEEAAIAAQLDRARAGEGGAVAFAGDPGLGKSALLARAAALAGDMRVLTAVAVEAETTLAFAALHQLLTPALDRAGALAGPQAHALRVAFGLLPGDAPDRFLVALGALSLLSELAEERPVLCLVDDVQWADPASLQVLGFMARRLEAERVALLLATRDGEELRALGIRVLDLAGLPAPSAAELLARRWGAQVAPSVRERLLSAAAGNALALLEMPGTLTGHQLAGREPLLEPLRLPDELERVFRDRLRQHEPGVRSLLLLAAAEGSGHLGAVRAAATNLGLAPAAVEAAAEAGLVVIDARTVQFRHPLIRSAVYHDATAAEVRTAHRALAEVLEGESAEAERRAWHLARAAEGPDEAVAGELERSAWRTLARSAAPVAAAAFEQAAELSTDDGRRARRLVAAAEAAWAGGDSIRARALLDRVERLHASAGDVRADSQYLRALVELRAGVPDDALPLLLAAARVAARSRPVRAVAILMTATEAAFQAQAEGAWAEVGHLAEDVAGAVEGDQAVLARLLLAAIRHAERGAGADDLARIEAMDSPELQVRAAGLVWALGEHALARRLRAGAADRARARGAAGTLAWALQYVALDELRRGRHASAEATADEGRRLALETGQPNVACQLEATLVELAALRGDQEEARRLAAEALARATVHRLVGAAVITHRALARLQLSRGSGQEALEDLEALRRLRLPGHGGVALYALADLAEAIVRAGRHDLRESLAAEVALVAASGSEEARAAVTRARALLATGEEARRYYLETIHLYDAADLPLELARTELLFGEFLRRERRRLEARPHLRIATEMFERLGALLWAERAATELRATGQTARKRDVSTLDQLTAHERRVVAAVARGLTNKEIAAQLFISPRTVDYHLRNVFGKVAITSRAELIRLALAADSPLS